MVLGDMPSQKDIDNNELFSDDSGELLKKMYVDSALKTGDKINSKNQDNNEEHTFQESKTLSWKDFKVLNS